MNRVERVITTIQLHNPSCDCCCAYEEEAYYLESTDQYFSSREDLLTHLLYLQGIEVEFKEE